MTGRSPSMVIDPPTPLTTRGIARSVMSSSRVGLFTMQAVAALSMRTSDGPMLLSDSAAATVSAKVIHAASIPSSSSTQSFDS